MTKVTDRGNRKKVITRRPHNAGSETQRTNANVEQEVTPPVPQITTSAAVPSVVHSTKELTDDEDTPVKKLPFRFFDLPTELRLRIYEEVLILNKTIDLDPSNFRTIHPRMSLFLVNHQMHEEAYRTFYGQSIRLFPTHGRFFHTKKPLLARLPSRYRSVVNSLELRIGPGWSAPPRGQIINDQLGLEDCVNLRRLRIFIELDPSEPVFAGFRGRGANEETYRNFCLELLSGIFSRIPSIVVVEIDAYPGVKSNSPLLAALRNSVKQNQKILAWGPLRGWTKGGEEPGLIGIEQLMANMVLSEPLRLVGVEA